MKKKTYYHIILDQSGSMQDCLTPTISGFNEQLQVIRSLQERFPEQEIRIGLTRFNEEVMHTYFSLHPNQVKELSSEVYCPGGCTALFDAIGTTVSRLKESIQVELIAGFATAVIVVITDGYENASRMYNLAAIKNLIMELEASQVWTFSFLGATIDAVDIATSMNIRQQNSMYFDKASIKDTFGKLGKSMDIYMEQRRKGDNPRDFLNS